MNNNPTGKNQYSKGGYGARLLGYLLLYTTAVLCAD